MAVTTALNSGTLSITGDMTADDIAIAGTANPGEITVTGRNGTIVDGVANGTTAITGVTADLNADLGAGDNVINVDNVYLAGHLELHTRNGNDRVILGATGVVSTTEHCIVITDEGDDVVRAEDYKVLIVGRLHVIAGLGRDAVALLGSSSRTSIDVDKWDSFNGVFEAMLLGVTSAGKIDITSQAWTNSIAIITSAASAEINVFAYSGQNSLYLDTNYAASYISVTSTLDFWDQRPAIHAAVTVARCQTRQLMVVLDGLPPAVEGSDFVVVYGNLIVGPPQTSNSTHPAVQNSVIFIETGDGWDTVDLSYNVASGNVFASLSERDDTLTFRGNMISGFTSADGGNDGNLLNLFGNEFGDFAASRFS